MASVSVIIPAYNAEATIEACVESARRQRGVELEILVVDDGSTDGTAGIVGKMEGVRLLRQENAGPASARNLGIESSSGEWLAFLDSDEEWTTDDKLAAQLSCAARSGAVLVGASGGRGEKAASLRRCLLGNPFVTSCVLVSRKAVLDAGAFPAGRFYSEDYLLWLLIVARGGKALLADLPKNRDLGGRRAFEAGGLSGQLSSMQAAEEENFRILCRKRLLARTPAGNLLWLGLALSYSRLKYLRRLIVSSARGMRRSMRSPR
jgi:glycosyltransferase involved in cell wall biosynthesis